MEASCNEKKDRISDLPDALIQHILCFLPTTREAVRTSVLSKAWRRQWTHLPLLIFEPWVPSGDEYFRFIENTLALHDSPRIKKFHLCYDDSSDLDPQFTPKIQFAVSKCVEELILICICEEGSYLLPKFLIESASLVTLEMENCYFKSDWTVSLPSLKSLKIDARGFRDNDCNKGVENIVSGCPLLEWLELRGFIEDDVAVFSESLKVLSFVNAVIGIAIGITRPNLVELNLEGSKFPQQMIQNVLSSSPRIHSLKLVDCVGGFWPELVIASNSLKLLSFVHVQFPYAQNPDAIKITCPNLVELNMTRSTLPKKMIENALSGCPCINSLKLGNCWGNGLVGLVITSNSLKVLHLEQLYQSGISVSCPNLVKLDMLCCGDKFCEAVNLPSTVHATLDHTHLWHGHVNNEFLKQFQHVGTLTIQRSLVEIISDSEVKRRPPLPLLNSKCLTLHTGPSFGLALPGIAHALRSLMLETLVIKLDSKFHEVKFPRRNLAAYMDCLSTSFAVNFQSTIKITFDISYNYTNMVHCALCTNKIHLQDTSQKYYNNWKIGARLDCWDSNKSTSFSCLVSHLKTLEIIGLYETDNKCKFELEFIEFLLKNAQVLKKMTVSLEKSRKDFVIEFSRKLVRFPRYSRCANVELLCST